MSGVPELRERIEQIVAWAKTKTPCASHYECLLADLIAALAVREPATAAPAEPVSWKGVKWRDSIKAADLAAEIALHFAHDCEDSMCGEDADASNCETAWIES